MTPETGPVRASIALRAADLRSHGVFLYFRHGSHFCDPLVPDEWARLGGEPALDEPEVAGVVEELGRRAGRGLAKGIYSPVPIARGIAAGRSLESLLGDFRYEMIAVDEEQRWTWQGREVASRIRSFFLENTFWQPALDLWYFEYRVNEDWWDKCYFDARVTPLLAVSVKTVSDGGLEATLACGRRDLLDLDSLRFDARERLFCGSGSFGELMLSDSLRFSLLRGVDESCERVQIDGEWYPLHWPADEAPRPAPDRAG
jgi:hypothetical protein